MGPWSVRLVETFEETVSDRVLDEKSRKVLGRTAADVDVPLKPEMDPVKYPEMDQKTGEADGHNKGTKGMAVDESTQSSLRAPVEAAGSSSIEEEDTARFQAEVETLGKTREHHSTREDTVHHTTSAALAGAEEKEEDTPDGENTDGTTLACVSAAHLAEL
jgi:hypothetical protein